MARRLRWSFLLVLALLVLAPASASAAEPPWCGTPMNDAAENLPDGTDPSDPAGSFPHIPYYAVGCTLQDIASRSRGRMKVEVIGESALGRPLYGVTINELRTRHQQRDYLNWLSVRRQMLDDPARAQRTLRRLDGEVKMPVYIQGGIHGNEYEGVDAAIDQIERLATTPYGEDDEVDEALDRHVIVFNPVQNPDGRIAGTRSNGNGFDLNRDFLTQSQPETIASIGLMKKWLPPEMIDMHGYVTPTLIEATTKPHNPSIEYDLWLKWNQPRTKFNADALAEIGQDSTRPINDWCPETGEGGADGICENGETPGPDVAEGWDDWGPFYGPMYMQHVGLDSSTVEMCQSVSLCGGRAGARQIQNVVQASTLEFTAANHEAMLDDELEMYIRGDTDAPRPECCPEPFDAEFHNWMQDYPQAYVIPFGEGQRSDAEANRLVEWLLFNDIEVSELRRDTRYGGRTFERGSYVVKLAQPRRGLADTALSIGVDVSPRIQRLYAPPAAWSHGYLWGADTVTIPDGARFDARTDEIRRPNRLRGGIANGRADGYVLELDSPTAVRALNDLVRDGVGAELALEAFEGGPAGSVVFGDDRRTERALEDVGRDRGLTFARLRGDAPATEAIEEVPTFAVITGNNGAAATTDQSTWVLRELGFEATPLTVQQINNTATDPLAGHDLIYNATVNYPAAAGNNPRPIARNRLAAFFAAGGGYIGGQENGADFLANGGQVAGLAADSDSGGGDGYSGIMFWDNTGGAASVIMLGAEHGKRTLVGEVDAKGNLSDFYETGPTKFEPREVRPNLFAMSMDTEESLKEYVRLQLRIPLLARIGPLARTFDFVANAAPGVKEILTIGKFCWEVRQQNYDLVVVDAAATGHVVSQLSAPQAINDLVSVGMVREQTGWMVEILDNPKQTGVVVVAAPEEMPVNETIELAGKLRSETAVDLAAVVVNRVLPELFGRGEEEVFERLRQPDMVEQLVAAVGGPVAPVLDAAELAVTLRRTRAGHLTRLRESLEPDLPMLYVPYLFTRAHGMRATHQVAAYLGEELGY